MVHGVKINDIVLGTGEEAVRGKTVVANVRIFLNKGTEVTREPRQRIDLSKRECIAGLRYGVEGMRVGGRRALVLSPHLAYGSEGIPELVPPNAVLRCEVELLEVREAGTMMPDDYPPGRHLIVLHPGEAARDQPQWQFNLTEDGHAWVFIKSPIPGVHWRHARQNHRCVELDAAAIQGLFESVLQSPSRFPEECLQTDDLWVDRTERGNAITRAKHNNALCLTFGVQERGQWVCYYSIAENSRALLDSPLIRSINHVIAGSPLDGDNT